MDPALPHRANPRAVVAFLVVALAVWNLLANTTLTAWLYVPANAMFAAVVIGWLVHSGLTRHHLGWVNWRHGLVVGVIAAAGVAVLVGVAALTPPGRELFTDARFRDVPVVRAIYQAVVRIPLGTALFEELLFRGALFGALLGLTSRLRAAIWSSLAFGLWHLLPTAQALETNALGGSVDPWLVIGGMVATSAAGLGFVWLRERADSVLAPVIVHAVVNSLAYVIGWTIGG